MVFFIKAVMKLIPFFWELVFGKNTSIQRGFKTHPKMVLLIVLTVGSLALAAVLFSGYVSSINNYNELNKKFKQLQDTCNTPVIASQPAENRIPTILQHMQEIEGRERGSK